MKNQKRKQQKQCRAESLTDPELINRAAEQGMPVGTLYAVEKATEFVESAKTWPRGPVVLVFGAERCGCLLHEMYEWRDPKRRAAFERAMGAGNTEPGERADRLIDEGVRVVVVAFSEEDRRPWVVPTDLREFGPAGLELS